MQHWQELSVGTRFTTQGITISEQDILEFAEDFDPQPYHLDRRAAADSIFGGLCASGWHVCAVMMRLLSDQFTEFGLPLLGSTAVPQLQWRAPVFAGDTLRADAQITAIAAVTEPGRLPAHAAVSYAVTVLNQNNLRVITLDTVFLIAGRESHYA